MLVFLAFGLLASAITSNKILLYAIPPELLVAIRMIAGGFLLWLYSFFQTHHALNWHAIKKYVYVLLMAALFTTFFNSNLKAFALAHMPSSKMAFFGTLDPFITALYAFTLFRERLTAKKWLGIAIGFVGMLVLVFTSSPLEEQLKAFSVVSYPEMAAFFAIVLSRLGWIIAQQLLKKELFTPIQINIVLMLIGGCISLITAYVRNQMTITSLAKLTDNSNSIVPLLNKIPFTYLSADAQLWFFLIYTVIVGNVLGYTLYATVLKKYSATFVALAGFTIPLAVHFFGWLFLNESLSIPFFISLVITFIGLAIFFSEEKIAKQ